ncbi:hypothetical protein [Streptomyces sp. NPDC046887]|uniref:hypothetical protein n=1 Tax=Streptomyces sp. NPDC046887 TaxID=3155472 RepID=UPI0033D66859
MFDRAFALLWGLVAAAHVYMEVRLIQWLAMSGRPKAPLLAERVTWVAGIGFVMLLFGAVLPLVVIRYVATMPYLLRSNGLGRLLRPVIMVMVQPVLKAQARYRAEHPGSGVAGRERGAP